MSAAEQSSHPPARLKHATAVFLVGNIEPTMQWYGKLGFRSRSYPPGFAILCRDNIEIFLQQQPGYVAPEDPGRAERDAWDLYIVTRDLAALHAEFSALEQVTDISEICEQEHGMAEFYLRDLNGRQLVFAEPLDKSGN